MVSNSSPASFNNKLLLVPGLVAIAFLLLFMAALGAPPAFIFISTAITVASIALGILNVVRNKGYNRKWAIAFLVFAVFAVTSSPFYAVFKSSVTDKKVHKFVSYLSTGNINQAYAMLDSSYHKKVSQSQFKSFVDSKITPDIKGLAPQHDVEEITNGKKWHVVEMGDEKNVIVKIGRFDSLQDVIYDPCNKCSFQSAAPTDYSY